MHMRGKRIILLTMLFVLSGFSVGYASEDALENVITLEQAKELAGKNSRNLTKYEISREIAKYQLYQVEDQYDDAGDELDNSVYKLNNLNSEYSDLQKKLDEGDTSVVSRMSEIQEEMDSIWEKIDKQSDTVESLLDKKRDAETKYNDAVIDEENYEKQLDYIVEELYTTILNQEKSLTTLNKERELKLYLLNLEKVRLGLGRSSRLEVDQLSKDVASINKRIIEMNNSIKTSKGKLNDMMGRDYDDALTLAPFEVSEIDDVPDYDVLLSRAAQNYDKIDEIKRDIEQREDDLDDIDDDDYQDELLELEIDDMELQLKDERYKLVETINNLITDVKAKQEDYQLSITNYENAKKNYDWDKKRFELGQISKLDLMESALNYLNAENEKVSAGYDLYLAQRSLELAEDGILLQGS